jgi:ABC-type transport system, involved in lipoprotein release, permease component
MKMTTKYAFKKMKKNSKQLVGMGILIIVATLFFVTLFSFKNSYQSTVEKFFADYDYADMIIQGSFTDEDLEKLMNLAEIKTAEKRWIQDFKEETFTARLISMTSKVNQLYLVDGRMPTTNDECVIISQYYKVADVEIGDTITVNNQNLTIVGVVNSPEYVYYVKNARTIFTDANTFLVAYVHSSFVDNHNQIILTQNGPISDEKLREILDFEEVSKQKNQVNYQMYEGDLEQFISFAYIFPTIFWIMSFCIIYIILRRIILKDRKLIGVMKAIGINAPSIMKIYIFQFIFLGSISSLVGCLLSIPVSRLVVYAFKSMIEVPNLQVDVFPMYWLLTILISSAGCLLFGVLSISDTIGGCPHEFMKAREPRVKQKVKGKEKIVLRLSFNTRYALVTALRNKGRFVVMLIGLIASTALLTFSLGFNDSLNQMTPQYFQNFAHYDLIIESEPVPLKEEILSSSYNYTHQDKSLQLMITVDDEEYPLIILDKGNATLNISEISLREGVVIPEYFAENWGVDVGDTIAISDAKVTNKKVVVSEIIPLGMMLGIYTSYDYAISEFAELPRVYNTLYVRSNNITKLSEELLNNGFAFSTADEDRASFSTMLDGLGIIIMLLVICGVVLGLTVIICLNIMNLSAREFEYMFMNIMGYSKKQILIAITKEIIAQLIIAIPLGLVMGYQLINIIKGEFSQNTFALYPIINSSTYVIVAVLVLIMSMTRLISSNKFIDNLDIVEGLKIQED